MAETIAVSCNRDCGGGCPLLAHIEGGRVTRISDNPLGGPYLRGCVRGYQMARTLYAPDRLTVPLVRTGPRGSGQFRRIGWPEALDRVAERLTEVVARHGNAAILPLGGSGSCRGALHNTSLLLRRFLGLCGGYTATHGSYSAAAVDFTVPYVLGTSRAGMDPGTLQWSRFIVLWGANISECRMGGEWLERVREARERGAEVVVVDPRRTPTCRQLASQWIPVWPGTDAALMLAVLHVLVVEGLDDPAFAGRYSVGYGDLRRYVLGEADGQAKTPQWAERLCGTPAEVIVDFARRYGRAKPAALLPGLSYQRTVGGEEAVRLGVALQVATGNLGRLGGSSGAWSVGRLPRPSVGSLTVPANPLGHSIPVYRWPDAVLGGQRGGYPSDIAAAYVVGGNLLMQGSDIHKNIRAFDRLEFAVCHDYFLTPTARHCDLVLPVTTFLERQDIVFPDGNYLLFSNQAVEPLAEARNDYDIFCALAERLGFRDAFSEGKTDEQWLRSFVEGSGVHDYEAFKRTGIHWGEDQLRVGLAGFVADPQAHPLETPSGRVELSSARYAQMGYPALPQPRILPAEGAYPLRLVTPKSRYRVHSQNSNLPWFRELEAQELWINPGDAAMRGIADSDEVYVLSAQGRLRTRARVTEDIMPGALCLLQGIWPTFDPDGTETSGSANVLTSTEPTTPSEGSRTHSVLVEVKAARVDA